MPARVWCAALLLAGVPAAPASAAEPTESGREIARDDEIAELKRKLDVVLEELDRLRTEVAVPEEPELKSSYGLGPAASKVYGVGRGLSIGGYAEGFYLREVGDAEGSGHDEADLLRAVLYVGYKFTPKLLFNTELEFEHAGEEVGVEFATLDYLHRPELNLRGGLILVPMGFLNEIHEPPFYYGTARPEVEREILPTTWRENGVGVFGTVGEWLHYRAYAMNGFDASGFSSSGLRDGRQDGAEARADDLAWVGRVDVEPLAGLLLGGSLYTGQSGQDEPGIPDVETTIWELHGQLERGPLHLRALWAQASLSDTLELSTALADTIARDMLGGYAEIAYDVLALLSPGSEKSLAPFFRFEYLDTQHELAGGLVRDDAQARRLFVPGIQFKPHPQVVLKFDYRNIDPLHAEAADELRFGFGLAF